MGQYFFDANMDGDINGAPWNDFHGFMSPRDPADDYDEDEEPYTDDEGKTEVIIYETQSLYRWGVKAYDPETQELVFDTSMRRQAWDTDQAAIENAKNLVSDMIETGNLDETWREAEYRMEYNDK